MYMHVYGRKKQGNSGNYLSLRYLPVQGKTSKSTFGTTLGLAFQASQGDVLSTQDLGDAVIS